MEKTIEKAQKRIYSLDIVKIFACFCVVLMHSLRGIDAQVSNHRILYYFARCAIPLFFMVSGYLQLNKKSVDYRYSFRKIIRILIVAVAWSSIFSLVYIFRWQKISYAADVYRWFLQKGSCGVFWFFGTMIIIYLLLPLLSKYYSNNKNMVLFVVALALICVCIDGFNVYNICCNQAHGFVQQSVVQTFRLWTWLLYYSLGGLIGRFKIHKKLSVSKWLVMFAVFTCMAVGYMYYFTNIATKVVNGEFMYNSLPVIIWSICIFCFILNINCLNKIYIKAVSIFSSALIPVYALHRQIINF